MLHTFLGQAVSITNTMPCIVGAAVESDPGHNGCHRARVIVNDKAALGRIHLDHNALLGRAGWVAVRRFVG